MSVAQVMRHLKEITGKIWTNAYSKAYLVVPADYGHVSFRKGNIK
jgi:hypothetical protein